MAIFSLQIEKHVLGGLIKHQDVFFDIANFVTEHDFYNNTHNVIYCVIRDLISKGEKIDKVLLSTKIKELGISFKDEINIYDYIENISFTQITPKATIESAKELVKIRIRRELAETADRIKKEVTEEKDRSAEQIISDIDAIYNNKISTYDSLSEPEDIFKGLMELVEDRGNNPVQDVGFLTQFPEFNRMYGGLRPGNVYAIVSRPGQGKTSILNEMSFGASLVSKFKIKTLLLDTEMFTMDIRFRRVSALTGVPMWYLETGNWRKNREMTEKVRKCWSEIKGFEQFHYQIGNKNIDQVASLVRRWYYSKVGRGNPAIIVYDYIKLTGEKVGNNWAEHQVIGDKIDKLKKLSEELTNVPLLTAMQMNRGGENFNKSSQNVTDDSSAISLSDRLQWFSSLTAIFRRKTLDEIALDGPSFGTHKFIPLKTRFQGKDAAGHIDMVKRTMPDGDDKWINNYLNYDVQNFSVTEKGSARDAASQQVKLDSSSGTDGSLA